MLRWIGRTHITTTTGQKKNLKDIMDQFYLRDIWRIQNPTSREFSWKKAKTYPIKASRIDFALVSGGVDQQIPQVCYISSLMTDHRALYMVIELDPFERGKGYWKMNTSLLQKRDYIEAINEEIDKTLSSSIDKSPTQRWEILKKRIKQASIEHSKKQVSENNIIIANLSEMLNEYEERLPLNRQEYDLMEKNREELEEKSMEKVKGIMFRSKAKWYEQGEKNTKYFFSLEKAKYNAKTCYTLITDDNRELKDHFTCKMGFTCLRK